MILLLVLALTWPQIQVQRWNTAQIRPEKRHFVSATAAAILRGKPRYESVAERTGVPWKIVGCLHNMEGSLNFRTNLANGDTLMTKTRHVPKGRPPGNPPFQWEAAAEDALRLDAMDRKNWEDIGDTLNNVELYNGSGYQRFHPSVPSPYLWAGTTIYSRGKYIEDGIWSATAASQQCGVAAILKCL